MTVEKKILTILCLSGVITLLSIIFFTKLYSTGTEKVVHEPASEIALTDDEEQEITAETTGATRVQSEENENETDAQPTKTASTTAVCTDDSCFRGAVAGGNSAQHSDVQSVEIMPGVTVRSTQALEFYIPTYESRYTFISTTENAETIFADGWFDAYFASDAFPADAREAINGAEYLTEEQLALLNPESRAIYENELAAGKTPQDITKAMSAWTIERSVRANTAELKNYSRTCTFTDLNAFIEVLKRWETNIFSSSDLNFAVCESRYR